jgi:putative membrane protein
MLGIKLYKRIREKRGWDKAAKEVLESDEKL